MRKIIGNENDIVYMVVDKKYNENNIFVCTNGYQTIGLGINREVAEKLIPLLEKYLNEENHDQKEN